MSAQPTFKKDATRRLSLNLPAWMLEDLQIRSRDQGMTVTELVRRAISLERTLLSDPENQVVVRNPRTDKETVLTVL